MRKTTRYKTDGAVLLIPVEDIVPNPEQPRRQFDEAALQGLAVSIRENGLLQPLTVTFRDRIPVLLAGERRLRAARMAGLHAVPCLVSDAEGVERSTLTLVENLQREDMNCFETAEGIQRLMCAHGLTQEQAAARLGWAQSTVANKLRLLGLPPRIRRRITEAGLTERHARALLRLTDTAVQEAVLQRVVEQSLTVAQTERMVDEALNGRPPRRKGLPLLRDVRIFLNTVGHAVDVMRQSGIDARAEKTESDDYIEYHVRIPKHNPTYRRT